MKTFLDSNKSAKGHVALFALVLIPFLLTLTVLAVDIAGWNALRDALQREVGRIATEAAMALPNKTKIEAIVNQEISRFPPEYNVRLSEGPITDSTNTLVRVSLTADYSASFDHFLQIFSSDMKHSFVAKREAIVQLVPSDIIIVISDSSSLRPQIGELPWENSINWPYSWYFDCSLLDVPNSIEGPTAGNIHWPDSERYRWATQSCYNPVFSSLKFAAITLLDVFSASANNRIGLMFTPGLNSGQGYAFARHLKNTVGSVGGFINTNTRAAEAEWSNYQEVSTHLGDEACILFSYFDKRYRLPPVLPNYGYIHTVNTSYKLLPIPQCDHGATPYNIVSQEYINNALSLREAIYWHAAKTTTSSINKSLKAAINEFITRYDNDLEEEQSIRGNLSTNSLRKIILLSDQLPDPNSDDFQIVRGNLQSLGIELTIAAFRHPYLSSSQIALFNNRLRKLRSLENQINTNKKLLRVYDVDSPEQLSNTLVPKLIAVDREFAIRSLERGSL